MKKKIAVIICIMLIALYSFSLISNIVFAEDGGKSVAFKGSEGWGASSIDQDGWAIFSFPENKTVKAKLAYKTQGASSYTLVSVNSDGKGIIPAANANADWRVAIDNPDNIQIVIRKNGTLDSVPGIDPGEQYNLVGINDEDFDIDMLSFDIELEQQQPPQPGENPQNNDAINLRVDYGPGVDPSAKVMCSLDNGTTWVDIATCTYATLNGSEYTFDESITTIKIKATWTAGKQMVQVHNIKEGGVLEKDEVATISAKGSYGIQVDKQVATVAWLYDDPSASEDMLVSNGKIEINSTQGINGSQENDGGYYVIEPGTVVNVKLMPNYGYQLLNSSLNGCILSAGSNVSSFSFVMPDTQLHMSALFVKTEDIIDITGEGITAGAIAGGEKVIEAGNLKLAVEEVNVTPEIEAEMQAKAGDSKIVSYLDLNLSNIVYKGSTDNAWENPLTELDEEITITLKLAQNLQNENVKYSVIRKHGNVYTVIPATYNAATGEISFKTGQFSTYALMTEEIKTVQQKDTTPKTGNVNYVATIALIGVVTLLGMLYIKRK